MVSAWMVIKAAATGKVGTAKTGTFFLPGTGSLDTTRHLSDL